jgi:cellulose synthase/poly-beta-1,6-N-acetylglucosamine synthase-like glycosyltransferase
VILSGLILALLLVLAYAWVGYPAFLRVSCRLFARRRAAPAAGVPVRSVAILFSAHNEEAHMAARLRNLLDACEGLTSAGVDCRILVGADGCTDRTVEIAADWARRHATISVRESPRQGGKIRMLKELVEDSRADALVFTDANTEFRLGALEHLLLPFFDPKVGCVCGQLVLAEKKELGPGGTGPSSGAGKRASIDSGGLRSTATAPCHENRAKPLDPPEGSYWQWENRLKERESDLDSCLGVNGAICAVRRELFWREVPDNTIVDDFVLGMKVRERGYRVLYEPLAVAEEEFPETEHEWLRRVRIGAGDFQALAMCRRCLRPSYGWFAWSFFSHKVLRWFTPHMLLAVVALAVAGQMRECQGPRGEGRGAGVARAEGPQRARWNVPLHQRKTPLLQRLGGSRSTATVASEVRSALPSLKRVERAASASVLAGAALALACTVVARILARRLGPARAWTRLPLLVDHFLTMQAAVFVGWLRYLGGDLQGYWTRTPRTRTMNDEV